MGLKTWVQNDDYPYFKFAVKQSDGTAYDLSSCTVKFPYRIKSGDGTVINNGHTTCTITDAANGKVEYRWDNHSPGSPEDLATAGEYEGELEITTAAGKTVTIRPKIGFLVDGEIE